MPLFREEKEKVISSFDFIDIAKNRAVEVFYPAQVNRGQTKEYHLTNTRFPSSTTNSRVAVSNTGTYAVKHDCNFETLIEVPIIIEGDVIISTPFAIQGAASETGYAFVSAALLVSGASLTNLGNVSGQILSKEGAIEETLSSMKLTIPKTKIKKGEYLRANIQTWAKATGGTGYVWLGWDPMGGNTHGNIPEERDFGDVRSEINSQSQVLIPIRIDL